MPKDLLSPSYARNMPFAKKLEKFQNAKKKETLKDLLLFQEQKIKFTMSLVLGLNEL